MARITRHRTALFRTAQTSVFKGIAFKVASVLMFLAMSSFLKAAHGVPPGELVFFRCFFGLVPVLFWLGWRRQLHSGIRTRRLGSHLLRGVVSTLATSAAIFALTLLPLAEATSLSYALPLAVVVLSAIFLRETVRLHRWSAVAVGIVGVLVIAWPKLTLGSGGLTGAAALGVAVALLGALLGAVAQLLVRRLVSTEQSTTIVFYFLATSSVLTLTTAPFGWVMPAPQQAAYLVGAGICGGVAQILLTESFRHADMSVVAPFEYTSLAFSMLVGYVAFGDVPTWQMVAGALLIVGSGLLVIWRERQLHLGSGSGNIE